MEQRSISGAAKKLGFSVPGVSRRLSILRQAFHDDLFMRIGYGMEPTPLMMQLSIKLDEVIQNCVTLFEQSTFTPAECKKRFYISAIDLPVVNYGSKILNKLISSAPKASIDFISPPKDLFEALASGRINLAITPRKDIPQNFHSLLVESHGYVLMCSPKSKLYLHHLDTSEPIDFNKLNDCRICCTRFIYNSKYFLRENSNTIAIPNLMASIPFILESNCVVPIGRVPFQRFFSHFGIVAIPLINYHHNPLNISIVWHHRFHADTTEQWFRAIVVSAIKETLSMF